MKLFFLRHAEAEDGPVDAERALTRRGRRDARAVGRYLSRLGVRFDHAYTSPLVRAVETADLVVGKCRFRRGGGLTQAKALLNESTDTGFFRWLRSLPEADAVLLVGHEPTLSSRVRALLGVEALHALTLSKGMVARVDTEDRRHGELRLLLSPRHLP